MDKYNISITINSSAFSETRTLTVPDEAYQMAYDCGRRGLAMKWQNNLSTLEAPLEFMTHWNQGALDGFCDCLFEEIAE